MSEERKAACVIGWPVGHSRSPLIHNYWIKQHNLDADYRREAVPPGEFPEFAGHLSEHGYVGANVTVPHKQAALAISAPERLCALNFEPSLPASRSATMNPTLCRVRA